MLYVILNPGPPYFIFPKIGWPVSSRSLLDLDAHVFYDVYSDHHGYCVDTSLNEPFPSLYMFLYIR